MNDHIDVRIPIRRVQAVELALVANGNDALHLITIRYPTGDVLDNSAISTKQMADHIEACKSSLTKALEQGLK